MSATSDYDPQPFGLRILGRPGEPTRITTFRVTDLAKGSSGRVLASWEAVEAADEEEAQRWNRGREVILRGRTGRTRLATPS